MAGLQSPFRREMPANRGNPRRGIPVLVITLFAAFVLKTAIAYLTYGTNDITTFQLDLSKVQAKGAVALYREGVQFTSPAGLLWPLQVFSHPPSMIHVLEFWGMLAALTHLPLQFWMRFTCALADAGSVWVVWRMGNELPALRILPSTLIALAACPATILISGFHGNTDPIMIFLVLVSVYLIEARRAPVMAGIFMGLALSVKVVPAILIPAALLYLPGWNARLRFACFAGAVVFATGLPLTATDPWLILRSITSYASLPSVWLRLVTAFGISLLANKAVFLAAVLLLSSGMNRSRPRFPLFAQCGLLMTFTLFCGPGFGVQYLAWPVPFVACLGLSAAVMFYIAAGSFLFVAYNYWAGGLPWYAAYAVDGMPHTKTQFMVRLSFELFCWCVIGITLLKFISAWRNQSAAPAGMATSG